MYIQATREFCGTYLRTETKYDPWYNSSPVSVHYPHPRPIYVECIMISMSHYSSGFKCVIEFLAKKMVSMRCETLHAICLVSVRAKERGSCFRGEINASTNRRISV
jgi:hypothetical protein